MEIEEIKKEAVEEYKKTQTNQVIEFAQQMNQIIIESMKTKNKTKFYKKYTPEQVSKYLLDPISNEKQLREISRYLTVSSPQYWRLVNYLPSIAILSPYIAPFDMEKVEKNLTKTKKTLNKCLLALDNMNIPHEFLKVLQTVFRDDIFYGYEIETPNSYFLKQLDPNYCRIKGKYDGCFTYEFDFSFFDNFKGELENYAMIDGEFKSKYNEFKNKGSEFRWQELNLDKEVCIKYQESFDFLCPPFISVFNDLYDISDYKDLNKAKVEMDNTNFIGLKMPVRKDSDKDDDFTLTPDTMKTYFAFMQSCLQNKVGLFMSPMEFDSMSFNKSNNNSIDTVSSAIKSFWGSTGVSETLFGESKSANTLALSMQTDEALLFNVYRQIERFLSRKIKKLSGGMFKVKIPNLTYFNIEKLHNRYLKDSQYGFEGAITLVDATNGLSQNESNGLGYLEKNVFKKHDNMIPVQSSHTTNGNEAQGDSGRPQSDDGDLQESGEITREQQ